MKNATRIPEPGHITKGDIFDDLGFSPEEAMEAKIKSEIWRALIQEIEAKKYTPAKLAGLLAVHQPDVSNLLKGKISKFSITRFIQFAVRLNLHASVEVTASRPSIRKSAMVTRLKSRRLAAA